MDVQILSAAALPVKMWKGKAVSMKIYMRIAAAALCLMMFYGPFGALISAYEAQISLQNPVISSADTFSLVIVALSVAASAAALCCGIRKNPSRTHAGSSNV